MAVFTAASAACAASTSVGMLIAFRLVQAAGAALLTPTSLGSGARLLAAGAPARRGPGLDGGRWPGRGARPGGRRPAGGGQLAAGCSWSTCRSGSPHWWSAGAACRRCRVSRASGPIPLGVVLATAGVGASPSGWSKAATGAGGRPRIIGDARRCGSSSALFVLHCVRQPRPHWSHPSLFRSRHFTGASLVAIFFSASSGPCCFSVVLWEQGAWGWSALRAGLAIAPGPLMVPVMSFLVAGRLIGRYGPAVVIAAGSLVFAAGVAWWALAVTAQPELRLGGPRRDDPDRVGVGLTLPTMMATAAASLPPQAFATGSAVINMIRQTGLALGVAVLVAVLGTGAAQHGARLASFQHAWWVSAAISLAGIVPALALLRRPRLVPGAVPAVALEEI